MRIKHNNSNVFADTKPIYAADEDDEDSVFDDFEDPGGSDDSDSDSDSDSDLEDTLDGISDDIEDLQDDIDDIQEDGVNISTDNNIDGHYIAECDRCHGVFISAMTESDQSVESIKGVCPLCDKESEQFLKWVIKSVN